MAYLTTLTTDSRAEPKIISLRLDGIRRFLYQYLLQSGLNVQFQVKTRFEMSQALLLKKDCDQI